MSYMKIIRLLFVLLAHLTYFATISGSAISNSKQIIDNDSDIKLIQEMEAKCFDPAIKEKCLEEINNLKIEALLCAAYFDVFMQLCSNTKPQFQDIHNIKQCNDLNKLYNNYSPMHFKEQVKHFEHELKDDLKCQLCEVNSKICGSLVYGFKLNGSSFAEGVKPFVPLEEKTVILPGQSNIVGNISANPVTQMVTTPVSKVLSPSLEQKNDVKLQPEKDINKQEKANDAVVSANVGIDKPPNPVNLNDVDDHAENNNQDTEILEPNLINEENDEDVGSEVQMEQTADLENTDKLNDNDLEFKNEIIVKSDESAPFVNTDTDSHLFGYLLCGMAICVLGYIIAHNKNKLLAFLLEGRRASGGRGSRRRHTASYRKLDSNIEEAITSTDRSNFSQVIY